MILPETVTVVVMMMVVKEVNEGDLSLRSMIKSNQLFFDLQSWKIFERHSTRDFQTSKWCWWKRRSSSWRRTRKGRRCRTSPKRSKRRRPSQDEWSRKGKNKGEGAPDSRWSRFSPCCWCFFVPTIVVVVRGEFTRRRVFRGSTRKYDLYLTRGELSRLSSFLHLPLSSPFHSVRPLHLTSR